MANLRQRQKQLTRETLLHEALRLFGDNRYQATTIDEIAAAAGTTRATFYLHFSSKTELMRALIDEADRILTEIDDPPLRDVVASGEPRLIREYIDTKFDQWAIIKPYLVIAHQAWPSDAEVADIMETWFASVAHDIREGLDLADRFEPESRAVRGILAFGQLEYLSTRWFRQGWLVPRDACLEQMTSSWCHLLIGEDARSERAA